MNRIYQGRVRAVELLDEKGNEVAMPEGRDGLSVLWEHHELFQDAVNYYLMALFALAGETNERVSPIRRRLAEVDSNGSPTEHHVWTRVSRRGKTWVGMRDSVARSLGLNPEKATPEACFAAILKGNDADPELLELALRELLQECSGEGAIQQKGREMLPRFCWKGFSGSYPKSSAQLNRAQNELRLHTELHKLETDGERRKFAAQVELSWVVNLDEAAPPEEGECARARLKKALAHFQQVFGGKASTKMGDRVRTFLQEKPRRYKAELKRLAEAIDALPKRKLPVIPRNRRSIPDRSEALLLFKYFPSEFTQELLKVSFPYKEPKKAKPTARADKAKTEEASLLKFGDDPIKLARGKRGFIFPAFTALPMWGEIQPGEMAWKEFDIAAFKEALKALHQIEEKGKEREKERQRIQYRLDCMWGRAKWKAASETEESDPVVLAGDPRIERLTALLAPDGELANELELVDGQSVAYGLNRRTIRGFRDLRKEWNRIVKADTEPTPEVVEHLREALREYQRANVDASGSVRLYLELLKPENWLIWRKPTEAEFSAWRKAARLPKGAQFAQDPLAALTEARQLERDVERLREPIRFTPAHPIHSRRQFLFSDVCKLTQRGRYRHEPNRRSVVVPVAVRTNGIYAPVRARLHYSAPRLLRDQLRSDKDENLQQAPFLQPMMEALGIGGGIPQKLQDHPVALMPDETLSGQRRILLNFPINLDTGTLIDAIGKGPRWEGQFATMDGRHLYLRWPSLTGTVRKPPRNGWWWDTLDRFSCLSVDLGQRDAGAFARLEIRANDGSDAGPSRCIGETPGKVWRATVDEVGLFRLPGEDAQIFRGGCKQTEFYGERGRSAERWEWEEAVEMVRKLRPDLEPARFVGETWRSMSFPEQNDGLLRCFRLAQRSLAGLQSLSWRLRDPDRKAAAVAELEERWETFAEVLGNRPRAATPEAFAEVVDRGILRLRQTLSAEIVRLAERILPSRRDHWEWRERPANGEGARCHVLVREPGAPAGLRRKRMGQRGLSLERIEQLEDLRRRTQALNRALLQQPGVRPRLGETRGRELPDPCPEIGEKLARIREQRVNQTAHMILARALGLRLRAPRKDPALRKARDIHGEYEKYREPVDFIVMEDLSRYLSSQGRAPSENSRLMKWCHRALLAKLREICEPYGLPVLEAPAAYSSRFCAQTGSAGFRAVELSPRAVNHWPWRAWLDSGEPGAGGSSKRTTGRRSRQAEQGAALLAVLLKINEGRDGKPPRTLLAPMAGGPLFCSAEGRVRQADINAAINIGLRATAAPQCLDVHHRIRSVREGEEYRVRRENNREKACWSGEHAPVIVFRDAGQKKSLAASSQNPNFFVDCVRVARFDRVSIKGAPADLPFASGRGLWGTLRKLEWQLINRCNNDRLEKWGFGRPLDESAPRFDEVAEDEDDDVEL